MKKPSLDKGKRRSAFCFGGVRAKKIVASNVNKAKKINALDVLTAISKFFSLIYTIVDIGKKIYRALTSHCKLLPDSLA